MKQLLVNVPEAYAADMLSAILSVGKTIERETGESITWEEHASIVYGTDVDGKSDDCDEAHAYLGGMCEEHGGTFRIEPTTDDEFWLCDEAPFWLEEADFFEARAQI